MNQAGRMTWARLMAIGLAASLLAGGAALAVTDEEIFRDFRFNLSNPGARSLGLGGAFIAVADDATAALANPAGLVLLERSEFFVELRDTVVEDSESSQSGVFAPSDMSVSATIPAAGFSPSFISYVYPWENVAVGVSRHELVRADNRTRSALAVPLDPNNPSVLETITGEGQIDTEMSVWNLSGAVQLGRYLSFGATVAVGVLDVESTVANLDFLPGTTELLFSTSIDDQDKDVAFNAGVLWTPHPTVSFGAVYRGGMEFTLEEFVEGNFLAPAVSSPIETTFNTPDSYGAGASWRPIGRLTFSFDWVHVEYEDLLEGFQPGLNMLTVFGEDNQGNFVPPVLEPEDFQFTIENANEFHFGVEYVFSVGTIPWAVRAGAFTDHNSRLYWEEEDSSFLFANEDTFPERDTETHITLGTGVVVKERFQIDAAASISDIANEYVLSTIFRF